jgi:hypothetical protein
LKKLATRAALQQRWFGRKLFISSFAIAATRSSNLPATFRSPSRAGSLYCGVKVMLRAKDIVMSIGLRVARELRANELDQVSGGFAYGGDGNGFVRLPPPHPPIIGPVPVNPPAGGGSGGSGSGGNGFVGKQPPRTGGHGIYLF